MGYIINELFRFRMIMAGVYVGIAISSSYGFAILTEHLKREFDFSQSDITTISTVGNCVGYLSFFAGMLFDYGGPKVVFPIAGFLGFFGFLLFGLAMDGTIALKKEDQAKNVICFSIFNAILYLGCPAMDVSTLMPLMMNFPLDRGYMVIIQKTFAGLGTSVLMVYFNGFFRDAEVSGNSNYSGYVYFVGSQIFFCGIIGAIFIDLPPYYMTQYRKARVSAEEIKEREGTLKIFMSQRAPKRRLFIGCALVFVNLVFLVVASVVTGYVQTHKTGHLIIAILAMFILSLFALMALPCQIFGRYTPVERTHKTFAIIGWVGGQGCELVEAASPTPAIAAGSDGADADAVAVASKDPAALSSPIENMIGEEAEDDSGAREPEGNPEKVSKNSVGDPQYRGSFWRHLLTPDLWLLWLSFFGMWGTGSIMQMNSAQIYRSKNHGVFNEAQNTLYVALIGVGSALGRISSGFLDMQLQGLKKRDELRKARVGAENFVPSKYAMFFLTTCFLPVGSALLFLAYLIFAVAPTKALILPFLIGGIGTGVGWGLGALCIRIMYQDDIGKHYNFMFSSGFICTIALNRFMFGGMYDKKARQQGTAPACNKPSCVRDQMLILMSVNVMSTIAAIIIHWRFSRYVTRERRAAERLEEMEAGCASGNDVIDGYDEAPRIKDSTIHIDGVHRHDEGNLQEPFSPNETSDHNGGAEEKMEAAATKA